MQNRIYKAISSIVTAAVILAGLLFMVISYHLYSAEAKQTLTSAADTALAYTSDPAELYITLSNALNYDVRITQITADGSVVYDSTGEAITENHMNRPEVEAALRTGRGFSERFSDTLSQQTYYYAVKCGDGMMRFSMQMQSIAVIFIGAVPFFMVALGIVMVIAVVVSMKLSDTLMKPVRQMISSMDVFRKGSQDFSELDRYEEFVPLVKLIKRMRAEIKEYIGTLSAEKRTIELITANMTEGMILIDDKNDIISINKSAAELVNPMFPCVGGRNIIEFCRSEDFLTLIDRSDKEISVTGTFSAEGRYLRAFISRINDGGKYSGAVIIIVDETEVRLAEEMRRDFSANVSHELKTPLTTVRGFAEMIGSGMITDSDDTKKYGKRIYDESNRLLNVINDIIRLSEIEEKTTEVFVNTDIAAIAENVAEELAEKAQKHKVTVTVKGEKVYARVSQGYIFEMIYNLTENAVKYNREGGKVVIELKTDSDKAVIAVSDDGIGIPKEHQGRIFERFYRVDKSHSKQTGGTGLGLSIVKHIAVLHNGSVTLESDKGKGSVFTVVIPV